MELREEGDYNYICCYAVTSRMTLAFRSHASAVSLIVSGEQRCIKAIDNNKMGSDKSTFGVSLIVRDKVTKRQVSTDHNF